MKIGLQEIHIWYTRDDLILDKFLLKFYESILNEEEKNTYHRFHFYQDRHQYLITRALVRCIFSLYYPHIQPKHWEFEKNFYGKPFVLNHVSLNFNISHTQGAIVMAAAQQASLGIDIENIVTNMNFFEIANHYFSPQEIFLLKNTPTHAQPEYFFSLWTLKEAFIKARGEGLTIPLQTLCFADAKPHLAKSWQFWQMRTNEQQIISLAVNSPDTYNITTLEVIPFSTIKKVNFLGKNRVKNALFAIKS